jgi:hypothetical protein
MQVKLNGITIGNFMYNALVELDETQTQEVLRQGVLRLFQGKPSGDWEKGILKRMFPNAKKRDEIVVKDEETGENRAFRRTDIPFSGEDAKALKDAYESVEITLEDDTKSMLAVEVTDITEYTGAKAAEPKFAREKAFVKTYLAANGGKLASGEARTAATFAGNRGIAVPTEPWEEDTEFLGATKTWLTEYLAKQASNE